MLSRLRALWKRPDEVADVARVAPVEPPPGEIVVDGLPPFPLQAHLRDDGGFPALDWQAVYAWASTGIEDAVANRGWTACGRAWLQHLGARLGSSYRVDEGSTARMLSSLPPAEARTVLGFMERTPSRIVRILDGVAAIAPWGKDALVVFDDADTYYRYVARHYPQDGEFGFSGGMHLSEDGSSYFVTMKAELAAIEPVIAHEMTHACLAHLPIPAWLNEGLAVNTERRLTPQPRPTITPHQVHRMHIRFWNADTIQEFWCGHSFQRSDQGKMLSYELATTLVEQLARDWPRFRDFAREASFEDAGQAAAQRHFELDLGAAVCALVERDGDPEWSPDSRRWQSSPERGAFA
jgi:hypothetical protein